MHLVSFCKAVNIPFVVYAFTTHSENVIPRRGVMDTDGMHLVELINSDLKKKDYEEAMYNLSLRVFSDGLIEHDEYQIYTMWFNEFLDELKLGGIIYVNANPNTCFDRVKIRNREGENIPLEYLQKCHDYHESWLSSIENKLTIEANVDTSLSENKNKRTDWVETIDEWISNELYKNESQLKENNSNNYPILRFDGACRGNPSDVIGIGCLIYNDTSTLCQKSEHYFMPDKGTNNVAEYKALIDGLEMAKENSITKINIQGDSQLIINQMTGVYKVKAENLIPLYEKAKQLETYFDKINYSHIKREFNKAADKLANLALDNICSGCYPIYQPNQEGHMGINEKKRAGRLQISLSNINKLIEEHPHIVIEDEHCDPIKGCLRTLQSSIRTIGKKPVYGRRV